MQIFLSLSKPPNLFIIVCGTPADGLYRLNPPFLFGLYIQLGLKKILGAKFIFRVIKKIYIVIYIRGCQIGMQGPQLCAEPRHFCKLDVATSRIAFLDLNLHVLQVAPSNSKN